MVSILAVFTGLLIISLTEGFAETKILVALFVKLF